MPQLEFSCGCYALLTSCFVVSSFISKTTLLLPMLNSIALFWFSLIRLSNSWMLILNYFRDFSTLDTPFLHKFRIFWCWLWILCCNIHNLFHCLNLPKIWEYICELKCFVLVFIENFFDIFHIQTRSSLGSDIFLKYVFNHCPEEI